MYKLSYLVIFGEDNDSKADSLYAGIKTFRAIKFVAFSTIAEHLCQLDHFPPYPSSTFSEPRKSTASFAFDHTDSTINPQFEFNQELLYLLTMSELLTRGMSAETYLTGNNIIIKVPRIDDDDDGITQANRKAARNEASIYTLLGDHPNIAKCIYISPSKQHIELEYYHNGTLKDYVNEHRKRITDACLTRWACQIIESIRFIHFKGVRHSDLRLDQWLLDIDMNARLSDFNGSGYDSNPALDLEGSESINLERASHFMPRDPMDDSTIKSDLFALGSVLYELVVGQYPYESLDDMIIESLYRQGRFPSVQGILFGKIILRCWTARFQSASDILRDGP